VHSRGIARRRIVLLAVLALVVTVAVTGVLGARARGAAPTRCERFVAGSAERAKIVTGSGERVVVIGDSWSAGLGLDRIGQSWPSRLAGRVHVAGFSGSGFSRDASECGNVSFGSRAPQALKGGADLVVVEGGLNDFDQTNAAIRLGFRRVMAATDGIPTVIVGPATAPSRAGQVPRVDRVLARQSAKYGVPYLSMVDLKLTYLKDRLHMTPASHRVFGDAVAARIKALGL
jgi:acyl-CoA thioesterase I